MAVEVNISFDPESGEMLSDMQAGNGGDCQAARLKFQVIAGLLGLQLPDVEHLDRSDGPGQVLAHKVRGNQGN